MCLHNYYIVPYSGKQVFSLSLQLYKGPNPVISAVLNLTVGSNPIEVTNEDMTLVWM